MLQPMLPPKVTSSPYAEEKLREAVEGDANDWEARKTLARFFYDRGDVEEAASVIWEAPSIPSIDFEIAFSARILAKGAPRRAIRLLNAVLENNRGRAAQNLGLANALLHHGMVMQAARFYGAAIEADDSGEIPNADLEHFLLWVDDQRKLWGDFELRKDELDELPWMARNATQAEALRQGMDGHTTPVRIKSAAALEIANLPPIPIEKPNHRMYVQSRELGGEPTPPPAVTIPMDRVAEKDRVIDEALGADVQRSEAAPKKWAKAATSEPQAKTAKPIPQVTRKPVAKAPAAAKPKPLIPQGQGLQR